MRRAFEEMAVSDKLPVMIQFIAGLALLGFVSLLVSQWLNIFGEYFYTGAAVWIALMCLIAWMYDRRQAKLKKSNTATIERD